MSHLLNSPFWEYIALRIFSKITCVGSIIIYINSHPRTSAQLWPATALTTILLLASNEGCEHCLATSKDLRWELATSA